MGASQSSNSQGRKGEKQTKSYPMTITEFVINKVANPPPPPPPAEKATVCSTEHYCQMEKIEIDALETMLKMDQENTDKFNLTAESFEEVLKEFMANSADVLQLLDIPTFEEEREQIAVAFTENISARKKEASLAYKAVVDETLMAIVKRKAADYEDSLKEAPPPPPPAPPGKK